MPFSIVQNMTLNKKVVSIVILGVGACLLSSLLNFHFSEKSRNNRNLLYQIQQLTARAENLGLMSKNFIQTGQRDIWNKITDTIESLKRNLKGVSYADKKWSHKLSSINQGILEYHRLLTRIHYPALLLNREKRKFQQIGLSFSMEVKKQIIEPYRKEEGVSMYHGRTFDPVKLRIKETAYDLTGLHIQQQLILTELLLDWDLTGYRKKKEEISGAIAHQKEQLRYLNILMGVAPEIDSIIHSLQRKMATLVQYEQQIVKHFTELDKINRELAASGLRLVDNCSEFSTEINSDISHVARLNRNLNWALLIIILCVLVLMGTLLGRDIIHIVRHLEESRGKFKRSEKRLKAVTDNTPGVVFQLNSQKNNTYSIDFVTPKITEIFGLDSKLHNVLDQFQSRIPEDEREGYLRSIRKSFEQITPWVYEGRFIKPDGETIWFSGNAIVRREGESVIVNGLLMDITSRKELESSMRMSQFIFDMAPIGIWRMGPGGEIWDVNNQGCASLGYSRKELLRMKVFDFAPGYTAEHWNASSARLNETGVSTIEALHQTKNGKIFPIQVVQNLIRFENQDFRVAFVQDITERKQNENALREREQLLHDIGRIAKIGAWKFDPRTGQATTTEEVSRIFDFESAGDIAPETGLSYFHGPHRKILEQAFNDAAQKGIPYDLELELVSAKGIHKWVRTIAHPKMNEGGVVLVQGSLQDITDRKQAEEELRKLRNYLSNIIDSMPSVLVGVDRDGRVTQWNRHAEQITGISSEEAYSQPLDKVFPSLMNEMGRIRTSIRHGQVLRESKVARQTPGENRYEDITIFPLKTNGMEGAVIRVDDVTEQVRMEEIMIQSEKMLSVGGLAAGMAHEINNPLAGMMQTAQLMAQRLRGGQEIPANLKAAQAAGITMESLEHFMKERDIYKMIDAIVLSGKRVAEIVNNMLSFARKEGAAVSSHNLNEILDKTIVLAATDYDLKKNYDFKRIEIIREYDEDLPSIPCQASKIQQVLLNILTNGAQALQGARTPDARFIIRTYFDQTRRMACMEIEDNGPGMDETTSRHIFDPFFTTKPVGFGTGLGLSVSYFIITENHKGELTVKSSPGAGAKFIIRLPGSPADG